MRLYYVIALGTAALSASAGAAEYLTSVASEVYQIPGTPKTIATRAKTCISQNLKPGTTDSQLIISSDLDGGTIVARSAIVYPDGLANWEVRSTFTFEAREGRFRIIQTNLERFNQRWGPIGKWTGSGWRKVEGVFATSATVVAQCVISGPAQSNDW